jgi:hypothetical protein
MADDIRDIRPEDVDEALGDMKLEEGASPAPGANVNEIFARLPSLSGTNRSSSTTPVPSKSRSRSPIKSQSASQTPKSESEGVEEIIEGDITVSVEPGKPPKLSRKSAQKVIARPPTLFLDVPDATQEASGVFQLIKDCIYGSKYMGYSEQDALDCDCSEEWRKC